MIIDWKVYSNKIAAICEAESVRRLAKALGALIVLISATSVLAACVAEMPEASYEDLNAAIADGAVERGWIPDWLPPSAQDIKEKHDLDTNSQIVRFTISSSNSETLPDHCRSVHSAQPPKLSASWWPKSVAETAVKIFFCDGAFLAFDHPYGYFWRP
jgi:hypothetical protein